MVFPRQHAGELWVGFECGGAGWVVLEGECGCVYIQIIYQICAKLEKSTAKSYLQNWSAKFRMCETLQKTFVNMRKSVYICVHIHIVSQSFEQITVNS